MKNLKRAIMYSISYWITYDFLIQRQTSINWKKKWPMETHLRNQFDLYRKFTNDPVFAYPYLVKNKDYYISFEKDHLLIEPYLLELDEWLKSNYINTHQSIKFDLLKCLIIIKKLYSDNIVGVVIRWNKTNIIEKIEITFENSCHITNNTPLFFELREHFKHLALVNPSVLCFN